MEQEKRRYFKPSEINQFTFCTESWRLEKLKKQRKIFLTSEDYRTLKTRFQRGNEHHKDFYNKPVYQGRRKSTSLVKIAFYVLLAWVILWILLYIL
ncbi:hypothetical protein [Bacillus sp. UMB0893]|uniref:hypothetical protein n=1 Tax=Bacillus sp. UMB0893 TaxID=2066053 RepID=UPI0008A88BB8|nr:hypothetical protein [Bacillus sp. UMB0893]OHR69500.1 hypothetical protein HMPREF3291_00480 [Bacillus sp. HMSC76G11]PLR65645.1 hypothetical protein CYJ36_22620 [Bacillus sp. UMB0893]